MCLSNGMIIGAVVSFTLDNILPGTEISVRDTCINEAVVSPCTMTDNSKLGEAYCETQYTITSVRRESNYYEVCSDNREPTFCHYVARYLMQIYKSTEILSAMTRPLSNTIMVWVGTSICCLLRDVFIYQRPNLIDLSCRWTKGMDLYPLVLCGYNHCNRNL